MEKNIFVRCTYVPSLNPKDLENCAKLVFPNHNLDLESIPNANVQWQDYTYIFRMLVNGVKDSFL